MVDRLKEVFKYARKSEKELYKLYKEQIECAKKENEENGLSDWLSKFHGECSEYATRDMFTEPIAVEKGGHKVWLFNLWMNSNNVPESMRGKMRDYRFPIRKAALWYEPDNYGKTGDLALKELSEQAEREKVLYEDCDVKITMLRRNIIPCFHSCQWCHKVSDHEYVFYIKHYGKPYRAEDGKYHRDMELYESGHADSLKHLEIKMRRYINDWYERF